ncbi:MAG: A/G-specific adenine glycosylase [Planctomycetota bacterium]
MKRGSEGLEEWLPDSSWRQRFRRKLVAWYQTNGRDLPWRRTHNPYRIWVSEVMLQQTQVETVKPYFKRFLKEFPTVRKLAAATEEQVLRQWEGLGYYRRARQLHAASKVIVEKHRGSFPTDFDDVFDLPGIGRYTAGAILSFSKDQPHPIVEANTIRLYSRLLGYDADPTRSDGQKVLWAFAESLLSKKNPGEINQALIELGGCVCKPRSPACHECPVANLCNARLTGRVEEIPVAKKKMQFENVTEAAIVIQSRGEVLIRKCQAGERWAGLWDFPRFVVADEKNLKRKLADQVNELTGNSIAVTQKFKTIKHGVTRFRIQLYCFRAELDGRRCRVKADQKWVRIGQLGDYPLSVTGRKISDTLQKSKSSV